MKLTVPQRRLLAEICDHPHSVWDMYKPAAALVQKGLAEYVRESRLGNPILRPTALGLKENEAVKL